MYSNKENVNILTSLLVAHGVTEAVVCPGSRNAPIAHNLNECPDITCHPVTDERSAGFYALGMAQYTHAPVVVCVTSGTALLNLAPAVAEAFYQHLPLVVVSADRPAVWIDQQDGQTLPQTDALGRFVCKAVSLSEPADGQQRWHCNRLVNEALMACKRHGGGPVHINVPISEPLFYFDVERLPHERTIRMVEATEDVGCYGVLEETFFAAKRPMVVVGQLQGDEARWLGKTLWELSSEVLVIYECLAASAIEDGRWACISSEKLPPQHIDKVLAQTSEAPDDYYPDFILYLGGTLISKQLKQFLRRAPRAETWIVNRGGAVYDTFMNLAGVIDGRAGYILENTVVRLRQKKDRGELAFDAAYHHRWHQAIREAEHAVSRFAPCYSQLLAVKSFFDYMPVNCYYHLHAANSMSVRLVNMFATDHVWCNRGVNGIEGSLSTAAGFSLLAHCEVFCIIGDLSFFYDQNALWPSLRRNFKVLLLNNHGGGIFGSLPGLKASGAHERLVSARHGLSAEGICRQCGVGYLSARNEGELLQGMARFLDKGNERPVVFEVFTDPAEDERAMKEYYQTK